MTLRNLIASLLSFLFCAASLAQKGNGKVISSEYDEFVLTHELTPAGPMPAALDPNGDFPYISYVETSNRPVPRSYHFVVLENDQLKVIIWPGLGRKVFSMIHKPSGKEIGRRSTGEIWSLQGI